MRPLSVYLYLFLFIIICGFPANADEPRSALDEKPSVEAAAIPSSNNSSHISPPRAGETKAGGTDDSLPFAGRAGEGESVPTQQDAVGQTSYVYDLKKLIIKSRENIKRVNDKIKEQAIIKRNQKREERAREYYQRGAQLTDEGKLNEAREYFEKAIRLTEHPEMTQYIKQNEFRLKAQEAALKREEVQRLHQLEQDERIHQQDAQTAYEEAVRLYKEKKFQEAKDEFEHVEELTPDYKAARSYLRIIDQDIIESETLAQKQQKVEMEHQQKEAEIARQREKEIWLKEIDRKEKERKAQIAQQAAIAYTDAVDLYKQKKFKDAKKKFEELEWVMPNYKSARVFLKRLDQDIAEEEERAAKAKVKALEQQRWDEEVAKRKEETERKRIEEEKAKEHQKQLEEESQFVYQAALTLFDKGLLDEALERFNDIEKIIPKFKSTRVYIAKIAQLKEEQKRHQEEDAVREAQRKTALEAKAKREEEITRQQKEIAESKERKEKEESEARARQQQLEDETEISYSIALELYRSQRYVEAREKFIEAAVKLPKYKQLPEYLRTIDAKIMDQQKAKEHQEFLVKKQKELEELKEKTDHAQSLYDQALKLYRLRDYPAATAKFKEVVEIFPNFKDTQRYLIRIQEDIAEEQKQSQQAIERQKQAAVQAEARREKEKSAIEARDQHLIGQAKMKQEEIRMRRQANVPVKGSPSVVRPIFSPLTGVQSKEEEMKEAQAISELAQKSSLLYSQITGLANDRNLAPAKKKLAQVEQVLNNLKQQKQKILQQMREQEEHARQEELKRQQEMRRAEMEKTYDDAIVLLREKQFDAAKAKFYVIENGLPNFRSTRQYLNRIEQDRKQAEADAILERTRAEEKRIKELQEKQRSEEIARQKAEAERKQKEEAEARERQRKLKEAQGEEIKSLAEKASILNDDILILSKTKDYQGVKAKFDELEKVLTSLQSVKRNIADLAQQQEDVKHRQQEDAKHHQEDHQRQMHQQKALQEARHEAISLRVNSADFNSAVRPLSQELAPVPNLSREAHKQAVDARNVEALKQREIRRQQEVVFHQGVDLYERKKYSAAKLIFEDLAPQDRRAQAYLKNIKHAMQEEIIKVKSKEEKTRTEFIAEHIQQERRLSIIREREAAHQRQLTRELEVQKRIFEDQRQEDRRRLEALKMEDRERFQRELQRRRLDNQNKKDKENYEFRRVRVAPKPPAHKPSVVKPVEVVVTPAPVIVPPVPPRVVAPEAVNSLPPVGSIDKNSLPLVGRAREGEESQTGNGGVISAAAVVVAPLLDKSQLTSEQRKTQVEFSDRRKKYLDLQYKKEQKQKAIEDRKRQKEEARQKAEEDKKQKIADKAKKSEQEDHSKELAEKNQKEQEEKVQKIRKDQEEQAKHSKELREQKLKEEQERRAQEEKRRQELKQKQDEERKKEVERRRQLAEQKEREHIEQLKKEELARQEKVAQQVKAREEARLKAEELRRQKEADEAKARKQREEAEAEARRQKAAADAQAKQKAEMEQAIRERREKLESERQEIQRKLTEGADAMYQEAADLYKKGDYPAAVAKFQDVEDILPNYKQTRDYINKARTNASAKPEEPQIMVPEKSAVPSSRVPSTSRDEAIQKTLDLFDPNAH